ncbi:hypothetical protein ACQY0O_000382 [Thecaphora frezii]
MSRIPHSSAPPVIVPKCHRIKHRLAPQLAIAPQHPRTKVRPTENPAPYATESSRSWSSSETSGARSVDSRASDDTKAASAVEALPGPTNAPFVWSETRQELCESLPYYRSYQSGSYVKGGSPSKPTTMRRDTDHDIMRDAFVNGYLLGGWPSRRDTWSHGGRVIISHGGGKSAASDDAEGSGALPSASPSKLQLKDDQREDDPVIAALIQTMRMKLPTVLIAAENYTLLPMKLNCSFAVLGWYIITDAWAEKEETETPANAKSFVRWKFRFEVRLKLDIYRSCP